MLLEKRAAKRSTEDARYYVTAEAITAAQAETEIMALSASGCKGAQLMRTPASAALLVRRQTSEYAKMQRKIAELESQLAEKAIKVTNRYKRTSDVYIVIFLTVFS